jgi:metal-dependent amidase/aminoacylase/carboxypeptidase family protein
MGVEDFSFFARERPSAFYHLGCGNEAKGITAPLHTSRFTIDEDCLVTGVAMQIGVALRLLEKATPEGTT